MLLLAGCANFSFDSLVGQNKEQVLQVLGSPISVMREAPQEMWAYKDNGCTKYVFFNKNGTVETVKRTGVCFW